MSSALPESVHLAIGAFPDRTLTRVAQVGGEQYALGMGSEVSHRPIEEQVGEWIDQHWDPSLTVAQWWQLVADSGFCHPALPTEAGGLGWSGSESVRAMRVFAEREVVGPPPGLGYMLAAPTIAAHGTAEQINRFIPRILNGQDAWCQLFSEPNAGSDLAGLQTRAERDGDEWRVTGQKVWTSQGHAANLGMLLARTDPDLPKHQGISYFVIDMDQPGVDVRPLKEMTGRTFFSEVFFEDAVVHKRDLLGQLGDGWRVGNTTLAVERSSIGAGSAGYVMAAPGPITGHLGRIVGDVVAAATNKKASGHAPGVGMKLFDRWVGKLGAELGRTSDPVLRQEIMELYSMLRVNRMNLQRARNRSQRTGGEGNIAKLFDAELHRRFRDVSIRIVGADAMLAGSSSAYDPQIAEMALHACAPAIYGGSDQIQRNILAERVLGLPKEPGPDKNTPFADLPKNS